MNKNKVQKSIFKSMKLLNMETFRNLTFILAFTYMMIFTIFISKSTYYEMKGRIFNKFYTLRHVLNDKDVTDSVFIVNPKRLDKHKSIMVEKSLGLEGIIVAKLNLKTDSLNFQINELNELYSNRQEKSRFFDYALVGDKLVLMKLAMPLKDASIKLEQLIQFKGKIYLVVYGKIERSYPEGSFKEIFILCPISGDQIFRYISEKWTDENVQNLNFYDNGQNLRWTFDKKQINFILEHSYDKGQDNYPLYLNFDGKVLKNISLDLVTEYIQ
jgi:hypothetical protein